MRMTKMKDLEYLHCFPSSRCFVFCFVLCVSNIIKFSKDRIQVRVSNCSHLDNKENKLKIASSPSFVKF
jgi:hypothetical protein